MIPNPFVEWLDIVEPVSMGKVFFVPDDSVLTNIYKKFYTNAEALKQVPGTLVVSFVNLWDQANFEQNDIKLAGANVIHAGVEISLKDRISQRGYIIQYIRGFISTPDLSKKLKEFLHGLDGSHVDDVGEMIADMSIKPRLPPGVVLPKAPVSRTDKNKVDGHEVPDIDSFESRDMTAGSSYQYDQQFLGKRKGARKAEIGEPKVQISKILSNMDAFLRIHGFGCYVTPEQCEVFLPLSKSGAKPISKGSDVYQSLRERTEMWLQQHHGGDSCNDGIDCDILRKWFTNADTPLVLKEIFYEVEPDLAIAFDPTWKGHEDKPMSTPELASKNEVGIGSYETKNRPAFVSEKTPPTQATLCLEESILRVSVPPRMVRCYNFRHGSTEITGLVNARRLIMIPSFRRSERGRFCFDRHDRFDHAQDVVMIICRDYEFEKYRNTCGKICTIVSLPTLCPGIGYSRYIGVRIAVKLEQPRLFFLDDDLKTVEKDGTVSIVEAWEDLEAKMMKDRENQAIAMVGATKSNSSVNMDWTVATPQVFVLLNLVILTRACLNYDYRLSRVEDFVLAYQLIQNGYLVLKWPKLRVRGDMTGEWGGTGSPASGSAGKGKRGGDVK